MQKTKEYTSRSRVTVSEGVCREASSGVLRVGSIIVGGRKILYWWELNRSLSGLLRRARILANGGRLHARSWVGWNHFGR